MQIVTPPPPATPPDAPWWVGKTIHCDACASDILLEDGDRVNAAPGPGDLRTVALNCPKCRAIISYSEHSSPVLRPTGGVAGPVTTTELPPPVDAAPAPDAVPPAPAKAPKTPAPDAAPESTAAPETSESAAA